MLEADEKNNSDEKLMSFWEHTEELVKRLKVPLYVFFVVFVGVMALPGDLSFFSDITSYRPLLGSILQMIRDNTLPPSVRLIGMELNDPLTLYLIASMIIAVALTLPVIIYEVYRFIDPALRPNERKAVYPFLGSFFGLFLAGLVFGYLFLTPYMMRALVPFFAIVGAEAVVSVMDFYTTVLITTVGTGIAFTFPIYIVLLVKFGIVGTKTFTKNRLYLYAAIMLASFFITPDGGMLGNLMLFIPMATLFEVGILISKQYERRGQVHKVIKWFSDESKCKFCGETIQGNVPFCPKCGRSIR